MQLKRFYIRIVLVIALFFLTGLIISKSIDYSRFKKQQIELKKELDQLKKFKKCDLFTTEAVFENCGELLGK